MQKLPKSVTIWAQKKHAFYTEKNHKIEAATI